MSSASTSPVARALSDSDPVRQPTGTQSARSVVSHPPGTCPLRQPTLAGVADLARSFSGRGDAVCALRGWVRRARARGHVRSPAGAKRVR
eukprot:2780208-Prymnesium_polylepis.2